MAALPDLDPCSRAAVSEVVAAASTSGGEGWASWNLGRARAADAMATLGPEAPVSANC